MSPDMSISKNEVARAAESIAATQKAGATNEQEIIENKQDAAQGSLLEEASETSAMGAQIRTQRLVGKEEVKKPEKAQRAQESVLVRKEEADGLGGEFSQRQGNKEYHLDPVVLSKLIAEDLGIGINEKSEPDEILTIIRTRMMMMTVNGEAPDVVMVDKVFEFLMEVTRTKLTTASETDKPRLAAIFTKIEEAKAKHFESNSIAIQVAQKIIGAVDAVATTTGQPIKATLDRYREVVHNPPELQALRKEYELKGYKGMMLELKGLNNYLGGNLKKNNLENPELSQLASAARTMQALLGVYRQSKAHIPTMESYLELHGIFETSAPAA